MNRDTQFQNFAKLLWAEITSSRKEGGWKSVDEYKDAMRQLIARRAYDLVCHTISSQAQGMELLVRHDPEWIGERVELVPDMTAFEARQHDREVLEEKARWLRAQRDNGEQ